MLNKDKVDYLLRYLEHLKGVGINNWKDESIKKVCDMIETELGIK